MRGDPNRHGMRGWTRMGGERGQPGRPPARGTRTLRRCSFDARNRGSTRLPPKEVGKRDRRDPFLMGRWSVDMHSRALTFSHRKVINLHLVNLGLVDMSRHPLLAHIRIQKGRNKRL